MLQTPSSVGGVPVTVWFDAFPADPETGALVDIEIRKVIADETGVDMFAEKTIGAKETLKLESDCMKMARSPEQVEA